MRKIMILTALAMFVSVGAGAQTVYDATNIASKDLSGTARFVGMGGAMGALGVIFLLSVRTLRVLVSIVVTI